jgi:hypothetical protein
VLRHGGLPRVRQLRGRVPRHDQLRESRIMRHHHLFRPRCSGPDRGSSGGWGHAGSRCRPALARLGSDQRGRAVPVRAGRRTGLPLGAGLVRRGRRRLRGVRHGRRPGLVRIVGPDSDLRRGRQRALSRRPGRRRRVRVRALLGRDPPVRCLHRGRLDDGVRARVRERQRRQQRVGPCVSRGSDARRRPESRKRRRRAHFLHAVGRGSSAPSPPPRDDDDPRRRRCCGGARLCAGSLVA